MKPNLAHILGIAAFHDGKATLLSAGIYSHPAEQRQGQAGLAAAHRFCAQAIRAALLRRPDALPEEREVCESATDEDGRT